MAASSPPDNLDEAILHYKRVANGNFRAAKALMQEALTRFKPLREDLFTPEVESEVLEKRMRRVIAEDTLKAKGITAQPTFSTSHHAEFISSHAKMMEKRYKTSKKG